MRQLRTMGTYELPTEWARSPFVKAAVEQLASPVSVRRFLERVTPLRRIPSCMGLMVDLRARIFAAIV